MAQAQILMQNVGGNEEETDDQDGDREEEESLPEHRFVQRDSKITLYIGDHIFIFFMVKKLFCSPQINYSR